MKKRVGAFLLAFTLALTSIVSYAEEESFTETFAELSFTEEMSEQETAEDIMLEESLPEEDAETWIEETAEPEEETSFTEEMSEQETAEDIMLEEALPEEDAETWMEETAVPEEETQEETSMEEVPVIEETEKQEIEEDAESETEPWDGYFNIDNPELGGIMTAEIGGGLGGTVTAEVPEGAFTEMVTLKAEAAVYAPEDADADILEAVLAAAGKTKEDNIYGLYVIDICFINGDGEEVEPALPVSIAVDTSKVPVDANANGADTETIDKTIFHINEGTGEAEQVGDVVALNDENQVIGMAFDSEKFSPFVLLLSGEDDSEPGEIEVECYLDIDSSALPDNEELIEGYIEQVFDLSGVSTIANHGEKYLSGDALAIYENLKTAFEEIAAGERSATSFDLSDFSFTWTYEELGFDASADSAAVSQAAATKLSEEINTVISYLLVDCPYDLYWYDKTTSTSYSYGYSFSYNMNTITVKVFNIYFPVISTYQVSGYNSNNPMVDTTKTAVPTNAAANAQSIVAKHADEATLTRLTSYKEEICNLVSYNSDAASQSYTGGYGDPWQLVYVFDEDPDTNVVCEGYSKAFQYLCDLDGGDEVCYLVTGAMSGGTGAGDHMWNIVRINGTNYLVDVTNSDTGTVGANGGLFLVTGTDAINTEYDDNGVPSYTFLASRTNVSYVYDDDTVALFPLSVLTLGTSAPEDLSEYDVILSEKEYTYDGTEKEPSVTVTHELATLVLDEDYRVSYSDNINAGIEASVTITGIGDYSGSETVTFTINPADISAAKLTLSTTEYTYDGTEKEPTVTVTYGDMVLEEDTDYTVSYSDNTNAGTATVSVEGTGNYARTLSSNFTIDKAEQTITAEIAEDTIAYGETTSINAEADFSNQISYESSDTSVVTVDEDGVVTAVGTGEAVITVTAEETDNYNDASTKVNVKVVKASQVVTAEIDADTIAYKETATITAESTGTGNLVYSSDNIFVVTVDENGIVTAVGIGTATITVTAKENDNYKSASATVDVTVEKADQMITAEIASKSIAYGDETEITASSSGSGRITYSSSDETVAMVSEDGTVTAVEPGTAVITVTAEEDDYYKAASVELQITVTKALQDLTVTVESDTIKYGETIHINAESSGTGTITYSSSDESVATVDEKGVVRGIAPGEVTITVTAEENEDYESASEDIILTVVKADQTIETVISSQTLEYKETATITVEEWIGTISYVSSDESVATVDANGVVTAVGTGETVITVTASGNDYYNEDSVTFEITVNPLDIEKADTYLSEDSYTYNGAAKEPEVTVTINGEVLTEGIDYTVSYDENVDAGTAKVTVEGIGNYSGTLTEEFEIAKADLHDASISLSETSYTYDGTEKTPDVVVTLSDGTVLNSSEYTVEYKNNVDAGTATVTISGGNNFINTALAEFTIEQADIADATVTLSEGSFTYDGAEKMPEITITMSNGAVLEPDTDYKISFSEDVVNAGTVDVTIVGIGNYTGTLTCAYTIEKAAQNISFETTEIPKLENAHPFTNELTVTSISKEDGAGITYASSDPSIADVDETNGEVVINGTGTVTITATAAETKNYAETTVSYELTITRLEGTITSNIGDVRDGEYVYDGETISLKAEVSNDDLEGVAGEMRYAYQWYKGDDILMGETGETLELSGEDVNVQEGTVYTCDITMEESENYFTDTVQASFTLTILQADNNLTFLTNLDKTYDGIAVEVPEIGADFGADTAVLSWYELDEDGEVIGEALDAAPIDAGMYKVVASIEGTDNYAGATKELLFTIEPQDIFSDMFTVDTEDEIYNGSAFIKEILSSLTEGIDYIVSYVDNTNAGTATITITGIGNYNGTIKASFVITEPEPETVGSSGTESQGTNADGGSDGNTSNETETSTEQGTEASTEEETEASTGQGTEASTEQETEASTEEETEASTEQGTGASTEEEADQQVESVETSDETPVMPVTMLFLAAGICFLLLLRQRREREER